MIEIEDNIFIYVPLYVACLITHKITMDKVPLVLKEKVIEELKEVGLSDDDIKKL